MARIARRGFWRERILPLLGRYPWLCAICGEEQILRRRGGAIRHRDLEDELESGEAAGEHAHQY
jgi:hypothetical protein